MGFDWQGCFASQLWTIENAILPIVTTKSYPNWGTIVLRLGYDWGPIGTQLAPNWPSVTTNWVNWRGAIIFHKITYRTIVQSNRGKKLTINVRTSRFVHYLLYWFKIRDRGKNTFTIENCLRAGWTHETLMMFRGLGIIEINSATPLVIMSSSYMHQLVKSMVNWNIYNDNIMTSGVA